MSLALAWPSAAEIRRDRAEVRAFRAAHPCPATGRARGACPGFEADHRVPLCMGGEDKAENLQWLTVEDHRWKTFVDQRECRKFKRLASRPAQ